ncbi:MAG: hypothetical protein IPP79_10575 [Chitinophagaceae bacterium]|nr:hypothetical protein [Chitinophagaceae bacterium]
MKSKINLFVTAMILFSAITLVSCKKENSTQTPVANDQEVLTMSEENTNADAEYDDIAEIGLSAGADMEAAPNMGSEVTGSAAGGGLGIRPDLFEDLKFKIGPCTTFEVSNDSTFPKTLTINYGDGCVCRDGKFRKGIVVMHFSAPIRQTGAVLTITLKDYYVNRAHIEGKKVITNLTENGVHKYAILVDDGKVTWPNGRGFKYEGAKVVTQLSGMDTRTVRDDVYSIEGRNKTSYANGNVVVKNTETALIKPVACAWIVKGLLKIRINDRTIYINFGNGDCDNKAILKWANGEKEITLP